MVLPLPADTRCGSQLPSEYGTELSSVTYASDGSHFKATSLPHVRVQPHRASKLGGRKLSGTFDNVYPHVITSSLASSTLPPDSLASERAPKTSKLASKIGRFAAGLLPIRKAPSAGRSARSNQEYKVGFKLGESHLTTNTEELNPTTQASSTAFGSEPLSSYTAYSHQAGYEFSSRSPGKAFKTASESDSQTQLAWLGYKEELTRRWDFWSAFSLEICNYSPVTATMEMLNICLKQGGPVIIIWGTLITTIFSVVTHAVLAELASAYPVSGGVFSWTFKLARANKYCRNWSRLLSWIIGFSLLMTHILIQFQLSREFGNCLTELALQAGIVTQLSMPLRILIALLFIAFCTLLAILPMAHSPTVWKALTLFATCLQVTLCLLVLITSKHWRPFSTLFTEITNHSGLDNTAWVLINSWARNTLIWSSEPSVHMAEETRDAALAVPQALFYGNVFSSAALLFSNLCFTLALPPVPHSHPNTMPILSVLFRLCPAPVSYFFGISMLFLQTIQNVSHILASGRYFWALARDKALPYAKFWRKITSARLPVRGVAAVGIISFLMCLLQLEKTQAIMIISGPTYANSLGVAYFVPLLLYAFSDKDLLRANGRNLWTLGRYGRLLSAAACLMLSVYFIIWMLPDTLYFDAAKYSWSPVILVGMLLFCLFTWFIYGRSHFVGPVKSITIWTAGYEVEIPKQMHKQLQLQPPENTLHTMARTVPNAIRSGANMTGTVGQSFDQPGTYHTYDSNGSTWDTSHNDQETFQRSGFE